MKKMTMILSLVGTSFVSTAQAEFKQVTNKEEVANIRRAVSEVLPKGEHGSLECDSMNGKKFNLNAFYVPARVRDEDNKVYHETNGQPVLLFALEERGSGYRSPDKYSIAITTDATGTKLAGYRLKTWDLIPETSVNVGTIAKPKYKKIPAQWKLTVDVTCEQGRHF